MTPAQRKFLLDLQIDPMWKGILDELEPDPIPSFRPVRKKESTVTASDEQHENWVYQSGRSFEAKRIISLLLGEVPK